MHPITTPHLPHDPTHTYLTTPHLWPSTTSIFHHVHGLNNMLDTLFRPIVCFFFILIFVFLFLLIFTSANNNATPTIIHHLPHPPPHPWPKWCVRMHHLGLGMFLYFFLFVFLLLTLQISGCAYVTNIANCCHHPCQHQHPPSPTIIHTSTMIATTQHARHPIPGIHNMQRLQAWWITTSITYPEMCIHKWGWNYTGQKNKGG